MKRIKFKCPNCGKISTIDLKIEYGRHTCPECGKTFEFSDDNIIKKDYIPDHKAYKSSDDTNSSNYSKSYPALKISIILLTISFWILTISQAISIVYGLVKFNDGGYVISLISIAAFFTISIPILAFSELLKILINIERNTRRGKNE